MIPRKTKSALGAALLGLAAAATQMANAATLTAGYVQESVAPGSSQLLTTNGGNGTDLFEDEGKTGGSDLQFNGTNSITGYSYVINAGTKWGLGDTVDFTGITIPLFSNSTTTTSNNTSSGTFTLSIYSSGANNDWEGTNNLGTSDDSLLGMATATFTGGTTSAYYVNFDSAINWIADSTQVSFYVESTGSMRIKTGSAATLADSRTTGAAIGGRAASLAGTVTPVPEPSSALLGGFGLLALLRRRRV